MGDLGKLAEELKAAGFEVSENADFLHILCCGFHVQADGYIRPYHNGKSLNFSVLDIIRAHVAPPPHGPAGTRSGVGGTEVRECKTCRWWNHFEGTHESYGWCALTKVPVMDYDHRITRSRVRVLGDESGVGVLETHESFSCVQWSSLGFAGDREGTEADRDMFGRVEQALRHAYMDYVDDWVTFRAGDALFDDRRARTEAGEKWRAQYPEFEDDIARLAALGDPS